MARVTVEDCLEVVPNRFELVMLAAKRARDLYDGAEARVSVNKDKKTVIALREIATGRVDVEDIHKSIIDSLTLTSVKVDDIVLDIVEDMPSVNHFDDLEDIDDDEAYDED